MLETSLEGEVLKSRDFLADAVTQLQLALPEMPSVQDDYSFRCLPQVLGAVRKAVQDTRHVLETESNSATDNPLIFPPRSEDYAGEESDYAATLTVKECRESVVSGGNFHGEAIAICLDTLTIALAELANISERRTAHLVDGSLSQWLAFPVGREQRTQQRPHDSPIRGRKFGERKQGAYPILPRSIPSRPVRTRRITSA